MVNAAPVAFGAAALALKRVGAHSQEIGVESQDVIAASVVVSVPCEAMEALIIPI
jgi:hypothetical protein